MEILFRGKRKVDNVWIYGDLIHLEGEAYIYINEFTKTDEEGTGSWAVYEDTVSQFTDVYDKHGNKIFKGDYIKDDYHILLVEWYDTRYLATTIPLSVATHDRLIGHVGRVRVDGESVYEIIGNRWDNEDLTNG